MSDADLIHRATRLLASVHRDAPQFSSRNVSAADLSGCREAREAFADFPDDEELQGAVNAATEAKNTLRRQLEVSIRSLRSMAQLEYDSKGLYHTFGFEDLTRQSDNSLHRTSRRVSRVARRLEGDLGRQGLTTGTLDALDRLSGSFDLAIEAVGSAVETRDIHTQQRIGLGNGLYAQLVRLASVGKSLFEDQDEARYNDYILLEPAPAPTPVVLAGAPSVDA